MRYSLQDATDVSLESAVSHLAINDHHRPSSSRPQGSSSNHAPSSSRKPSPASFTIPPAGRYAPPMWQYPTQRDRTHSSESPFDIHEPMPPPMLSLQSSKSWSPAPKQENLPKEIEICPGMYVPFYGSKETFQAIEKSEIYRLNCLECDSSLVCTKIVTTVLCPTCKTLTPATMCKDGTTCRDIQERDLSVGLGATEAHILDHMRCQQMDELRRVSYAQQNGRNHYDNHIRSGQQPQYNYPTKNPYDSSRNNRDPGRSKGHDYETTVPRKQPSRSTTTKYPPLLSSFMKDGSAALQESPTSCSASFTSLHSNGTATTSSSSGSGSGNSDHSASKNRKVQAIDDFDLGQTTHSMMMLDDATTHYGRVGAS